MFLESGEIPDEWRKENVSLIFRKEKIHAPDTVQVTSCVPQGFGTKSSLIYTNDLPNGFASVVRFFQMMPLFTALFRTLQTV